MSASTTALSWATSTATAVIDLGDCSQPGMQASVARFAQRKLGGQPLVARMARRLSDCELVDQVFIVGSNIPTILLTSGIAGAEVINLPSCHICERLCAVVDRTQSQWVVHVRGNRPFVDAALVDQLLARAAETNECDYVGFASDSGDPRRMDHLGLAGEACHCDTLRRLRRNADRLPPDDGGSIATWLESAPGAYHLKFLPVPESIDRSDLRFAIEDEIDWDAAQLLCETVSHEDVEWQQVAQVVLGNQRMRESMANRNL